MHETRNLSILLQDVWFELRGNAILKGVDWQVGGGGRWVLLGPNGSGKTTLLKLITGYNYPSRGRVVILQREFGHTDLRILRSRIGWVHYDLRNMIPEYMDVVDVVLAGEKGTLSFFEAPTPAERLRARNNLRALRAEHLSTRRFSTLSTIVSAVFLLAPILKQVLTTFSRSNNCRVPSAFVTKTPTFTHQP